MTARDPSSVRSDRIANANTGVFIVLAALCLVGGLFAMMGAVTWLWDNVNPALAGATGVTGLLVAVWVVGYWAER